MNLNVRHVGVAKIVNSREKDSCLVQPFGQTNSVTVLPQNRFQAIHMQQGVNG